MARFHLPCLFMIGKATWNQSKGYMSCSNSSLYTCLNTSAPAILSSQSIWYFQPKAVLDARIDGWSLSGMFLHAYVSSCIGPNEDNS